MVAFLRIEEDSAHRVPGGGRKGRLPARTNVVAELETNSRTGSWGGVGHCGCHCRKFILTERPSSGAGHPAATQLLWHLALTGFVFSLGFCQLVGALLVRNMMQGRTAAWLSFTPIAAVGFLAAAELLSYGYRLTLLLTPATYERCIELAEANGVPRQLVDAQFEDLLYESESRQ